MAYSDFNIVMASYSDSISHGRLTVTSISSRRKLTSILGMTSYSDFNRHGVVL
ncbi:hypothetical protein JOB18_038590 [Solea senegalensis]|uniref:Uncharacterized protein n=1 Tax=Solea senegalensis TaxID=28829 RepID=A0AAV6PGJ0_SOLSE|nr:hypothetical protein JOB18_038590 [Solea senegalensis]